MALADAYLLAAGASGRLKSGPAAQPDSAARIRIVINLFEDIEQIRAIDTNEYTSNISAGFIRGLYRSSIRVGMMNTQADHFLTTHAPVAS
jgi:hypothetical protein